MINRETDYAIRVLVALAGRRAAAPRRAPMRVLAAETDVPYRFLRKLASRLVAAGLVNSRKGKGGGLSLARAPGDVSLYDAVTAMAPAAATLSPCLLRADACRRSRFCRVHREFRKIQSQIDRRLKQLTLAHFA